ncbi:MAG: hypothetical protein ACI8UO_005928 [Verrucomicrobiales bacterium]|jgi:hypothetical protein
MAEQKAHVTSVEALDSFRIALIRYLEKARISLDEVSDEVTRTRVWLESEQSIYWKGEIRKYSRKLDDAQQALFSAELSMMRETSSQEERVVKKMRDHLRISEDKLRVVKKHSRNYDAAVEPLGKSVDRLRSFFEGEMPKALLFLSNSIKSLDAYASVSGRPAESGTPAAPLDLSAAEADPDPTNAGESAEP